MENIVELLLGALGVFLISDVIVTLKKTKAPSGVYRVSKKYADDNSQYFAGQLVSATGETVSDGGIVVELLATVRIPHETTPYVDPFLNLSQRLSPANYKKKIFYTDERFSIAMPKKYLKKIRNIDAKGGEVKMKRMPRIFRYTLYLALVVLVWDVVLNANNITNFVVHTFVLTK